MRGFSAYLSTIGLVVRLILVGAFFAPIAGTTMPGGVLEICTRDGIKRVPGPEAPRDRHACAVCVLSCDVPTPIAPGDVAASAPSVVALSLVMDGSVRFGIVDRPTRRARAPPMLHSA